jgi:hypothetical protein
LEHDVHRCCLIEGGLVSGTMAGGVAAATLGDAAGLAGLAQATTPALPVFSVQPPKPCSAYQNVSAGQGWPFLKKKIATSKLALRVLDRHRRPDSEGRGFGGCTEKTGGSGASRAVLSSVYLKASLRLTLFLVKMGVP